MELKISIAEWQAQDFGLKKLTPGQKLDVVLDIYESPEIIDNGSKSLPAPDGVGLVGEILEVVSIPWNQENTNSKVLTQGIIDCKIPIRFNIYSREKLDFRKGQFVRANSQLWGNIAADYPAFYRAPISSTLLDIQREGDNYLAKIKLEKVQPLLKCESLSEEMHEFDAPKSKWDLIDSER